MNLSNNPSGWLSTLEQEDLLHRMTNRIRQSLELQEILEATVVEVRLFLNTDRVKVYRFDANDNGQVIAESRHEENLPSLLGLHFPANDIPPDAREMFLKARQRSIVDVSNGKIGLSPLEGLETSQSLKTDIYYREVNPCHIEYLKAMGVQSSLVVPILHHNLQQNEQSASPHLWGLLVSHHSKSRAISPQEIRVVQQVADQVAIAISQSQLLTQARAEQQREAIINQVTTLLHSLPTVQLQGALEATIAALQGAGGRLYIAQTAKLYTCGDQPLLSSQSENCVLEEHPAWQNWAANCKMGDLWVVSDLYKEPAWRVLALAFRSTRIRGVLIIPLYYRQNFIGFFSIFRNEFDTEILWAGQREQNQQQQLPQISFAAWREERKGQAPEWKPEDIALAQALCHQFSTAIQQQQMYKQLQDLNLNLECQVRQQTAELQKSLQLANVVKQVTNQIRSTLDLKTILQTIVREIHKLLNTDRVLIYQLSDDFQGEVIVEEVKGNWQSVLGIKAPPHCFPHEYALFYFRGRIRAINNVFEAFLSPCHQNFLQSLQVQANLIVPINMGNQLWGLLIAHECESPRDWQDTEIELLQQLADQAAIAIQQAQLYQQSRTAETKATAKALQLEHTLKELQQTQTQLVQTEKMSSLGQLVAGLAHEINNPVNFIYGNLNHAINYTQGLLELLRLYQKNYPHPNQEIRFKAEEIDLEFLADDLPKIMSSMQVGSDRIRSLVLSLRNFSRLDHAEMKPVDLHEGIDNTLLILQHRFKPKTDFPGIKIIKGYSNLPVIECFAGQMNQVFMNILSNAIDAVEDAFIGGCLSSVNHHEHTQLGQDLPKNDSEQIVIPTIWISTQVLADNAHIAICIADNGRGMNEDIKKRIFDPFFTTKPVGKGTGLGLAISYQIIVEKHGGVIRCVSEPSKGTEFWIEIPLKQPFTPEFSIRKPRF